MTITQAEFRRILEAAGITIQQEPSEAMVKLAWEIVLATDIGDGSIDRLHWSMKVALAALRHAAVVVRFPPVLRIDADGYHSHDLIDRNVILTALGAA